MNKQIQPVVITPEKAKRIVRVIEQILSRHTGKKIIIESYSQDFSGLEQHQKAANQ